ncbi:MAG: hypothetical protein BWY52_00019 [Chloroflexi bacterium ADurb.Bin325]|nr:MAG: hypothetical protein BWY52_00019 [Chloroflexi bacterium ADurb.Bin325]
MSFKPMPCSDRWNGLLTILVLGLLDLTLIHQVMNRPIDGLSFLLGLSAVAIPFLMVYIAYRTLGAFTMEYWVDRDAVTVVWGLTRHIVPLTHIEQILTDSALQPQQGPRFWHWPCPFRRRVHCGRLGIVNAYATQPFHEQLVLVTAEESYGLSPADRAGFVAALQERYALGAARPVRPELRRPPIWTWPLWRDRTALFLIAAGLFGVVLMFGVLSFLYPVLSADLPLHFDVSGLPDRIAPKANLFGLPVIGLVTWLFNTVVGIWLYRRVQHGAAYLLWGGALIVQGIAGLALFNLMRW